MRLTTTNKYPVDKPHLNTPTKPSTGPSILHSSFQHSNSPVLGRGAVWHQTGHTVVVHALWKLLSTASADVRSGISFEVP